MSCEVSSSTFKKDADRGSLLDMSSTLNFLHFSSRSCADSIAPCRWDFHHLTKGMHYEKIADLIEKIRDDLEELR